MRSNKNFAFLRREPTAPRQDLKLVGDQTTELRSIIKQITSKNRVIAGAANTFMGAFMQISLIHNAAAYWQKYILKLLEFLEFGWLRNPKLVKGKHTTILVVNTIRFITTVARMVSLTTSYGLVAETFDEKWYFGPIAKTMEKVISSIHHSAVL
jgi:hypothetical protein